MQTDVSMCTALNELHELGLRQGEERIERARFVFEICNTAKSVSYDGSGATAGPIKRTVAGPFPVWASGGTSRSCIPRSPSTPLRAVYPERSAAKPVRSVVEGSKDAGQVSTSLPLRSEHVSVSRPAFHSG